MARQAKSHSEKIAGLDKQIENLQARIKQCKNNTKTSKRKKAEAERKKHLLLDHQNLAQDIPRPGKIKGAKMVKRTIFGNILGEIVEDYVDGKIDEKIEQLKQELRQVEQEFDTIEKTEQAEAKRLRCKPIRDMNTNLNQLKKKRQELQERAQAHAEKNRNADDKYKTVRVAPCPNKKPDWNYHYTAKELNDITLADVEIEDLCELAKQCDEKVDRRIPKANPGWKGPLDPSTCMRRGSVKHECVQNAINQYNAQQKENNNARPTGVYSEPGYDKNNNYIDSDNTQVHNEAREAAAQAAEDVYKKRKHNGKTYKDHKKILDDCGLQAKTHGDKHDKGNGPKGYGKRVQRKSANSDKNVKESLKALEQISQQANIAAAKAYNKISGARAIPDLVIAIDPNKPPEKGNIKAVYDFKFNCSGWDGMLSEGKIDRDQREKYTKATGLEPEIIHPNSKSCQ